MRTSKLIYKEIKGDNWHLRRENDGGVLIINGNKVVELNKTAFNYVKAYMLFGQNEKKTIWYNSLINCISLRKANADWSNLKKSLFNVSRGCCEGIGIELRLGKKEFEAPIRVDLALTYLCNNDCYHCYAGGSHKTNELSTSQWKQTIDKLWKFGVPQIAFTGGESLLRDDLFELIQHAKSLGMITGLITNGRLLTKEKVGNLENASLDFVQITIESHFEKIHNTMVGDNNAFCETISGIKNALDSNLKVTTNSTMTSLNASSINDTVEFLLTLGVKNIGLNGLIRSKRGKNKEGLTSQQLLDILSDASNSCSREGANLIWFTPTCYLAFNPLKEGFGTKRCSAASTVLAIEPDGRIIPCQSYFQGLGNINTDTLEEAWNHPLAVNLRERKWLDKTCQDCSYLLPCGGSCPLESLD